MEETKDTSKQGDSGADTGADATSKGTGTDAGTDTGATSATGTEATKPEFKDENMQKAFTEKTQALAEETKKIEGEREKFNKYREEVDKKLQILERLNADPEIVNFVKKKWGHEEEKPIITEEELNAAREDNTKMLELINKSVDEKLKTTVKPLTGKLSTMEFENALNVYADAENNEDFDGLCKTGLVKPLILAVKAENPKMKAIDIIQKAHLMAREMVNKIDSNAEERAKEKASGDITKKKEAIIDKGGKITISSIPSVKGKTIEEVGELVIAEKK